jgi:ribosome-associated heat shock protein Hsp15
VADDACRIDVWLWRARFFKTRTLAAQIVESGRVHLTRGQVRTRVDKPSRSVKVGDELVFAIAGRLTAVRVGDLGTRRGPPAEARALYSPMEES